MFVEGRRAFLTKPYTKTGLKDDLVMDTFVLSTCKYTYFKVSTREQVFLSLALCVLNESCVTPGGAGGEPYRGLQIALALFADCAAVPNYCWTETNGV